MDSSERTYTQAELDAALQSATVERDQVWEQSVLQNYQLEVTSEKDTPFTKWLKNYLAEQVAGLEETIRQWKGEAETQKLFLQSATERLPCGHWKGDWVEYKLTLTQKTTEPHAAHCRTCAEIEAAYQSGLMVTRGDIAQLKQEHAATNKESKHMNELLEKEISVARHIRFAATDGCQCEPCISVRTVLTHQLAVARAEAYRQCAIFASKFWKGKLSCIATFEQWAAEAEAQAHND